MPENTTLPWNKHYEAILNAEQSRNNYKSIRGIVCHKKDKNPLTQIEVMDPSHSDGRTMILACQKEVEEAIQNRNQNHG